MIHPTAIVDKGAQIGEGTCVWHWVHVCTGAKIGERCSLGQNVFIGNKVMIGNNVKIQNNVSVYDNVTLEDDIFCGPSMVFPTSIIRALPCRAKTNIAHPRKTRRNTGCQLHHCLRSNHWRICFHRSRRGH